MDLKGSKTGPFIFLPEKEVNKWQTEQKPTMNLITLGKLTI